MKKTPGFLQNVVVKNPEGGSKANLMNSELLIKNLVECPTLNSMI